MRPEVGQVVDAHGANRRPSTMASSCSTAKVSWVRTVPSMAAFTVFGT